jgi:hypothetical protein
MATEMASLPSNPIGCNLEKIEDTGDGWCGWLMMRSPLFIRPLSRNFELELPCYQACDGKICSKSNMTQAHKPFIEGFSVNLTVPVSADRRPKAQ